MLKRVLACFCSLYLFKNHYDFPIMVPLMTILTCQTLSDVAQMNQLTSIIFRLTFFDAVTHCGYFSVVTFIFWVISLAFRPVNRIWSACVSFLRWNVVCVLLWWMLLVTEPQPFKQCPVGGDITPFWIFSADWTEGEQSREKEKRTKRK